MRNLVNEEGLDAEYELKYVRDIANKFIERVGVKYIVVKSFVDRARGQNENW